VRDEGVRLTQKDETRLWKGGRCPRQSGRRTEADAGSRSAWIGRAIGEAACISESSVGRGLAELKESGVLDWLLTKQCTTRTQSKRFSRSSTPPTRPRRQGAISSAAPAGTRRKRSVNPSDGMLRSLPRHPAGNSCTSLRDVKQPRDPPADRTLPAWSLHVGREGISALSPNIFTKPTRGSARSARPRPTQAIMVDRTVTAAAEIATLRQKLAAAEARIREIEDNRFKPFTWWKSNKSTPTFDELRESMAALNCEIAKR
jgi:hypothetical protein